MRPSDPNHSPPPDVFADVEDALLWNEAPDFTRPATGSWLEESITAVMLTAPPLRAPGRCLTEIRKHIAPAATVYPTLNGHATKLAVARSPWTARAGWGLAATLAILAGWQTVRIVRLDHELSSLKTAPGTLSPSRPADSGTPADGPGPSGHPDTWEAADPSASPGHGPGSKSRHTAAGSMVIPDRPAMQRKLEELQRLQDARLQAVPGLARTVVMELRKPGSKPGEIARTTTLSEEVAGIIAAGMEKTRPSSTGDRPPFTVNGPDKDRPGDDIIIKDGLPNFSGFTLQEGVTLYHQNFPADTWQEWEGLHLLKDGSFYDDINEILWKPVPGEGRRFSGSRPQEPILLDEQAAPRSAPAPAQPAAPDTPAAPAAGSESGPLIWSIYDESRGEGRLVVSDLPPPPPGQAYQLWFEDARSATPITAGLLPPLDDGAGQVWFSLTPGISPVHYRLTVEPAAGSPLPLGPTVLTGP